MWKELRMGKWSTSDSDWKSQEVREVDEVQLSGKKKKSN